MLSNTIYHLLNIVLKTMEMNKSSTISLIKTYFSISKQQTFLQIAKLFSVGSPRVSAQQSSANLPLCLHSEYCNFCTSFVRICKLYIFIILDIRSVRTIYRNDGGGAAAWAGPDLSINKTQTQNIPRTRDKSDQASGGEL